MDGAEHDEPEQVETTTTTSDDEKADARRRCDHIDDGYDRDVEPAVTVQSRWKYINGVF